ncbi:fam-b protein [Plasmodium vinckei vinckei]|uniref:Fam-b protein n=1 Tax=Plasmodium vinckei vinckei TaxID=54757 RepID=A0A449BXB0_PLAVN|nr:fam-b protein [Plasmodium vinckei vinckei]VEV58084.1 fam-b protein [Plasmodium vinckei vinckei]
MESRILKFVFFSIIICSFEYAKNELYYVNERSIYLERNIIYFRNNRILEYIDNQFDLYDFYESTLNLANQFSDYIDDDKEIL